VFDFYTLILHDRAAGSLGTPCGCLVTNADLHPDDRYVVAVLQATVTLFLSVFSGTVTVGTTVMFLQYSRQIQGLMTQTGQLLNDFERVKAAAKQVFVLFDYPVSVPEASDATVLEDVQGDVTFDDVSFIYPAGGQAITDVSPQADPGETIGLAGPTGSGKATLMKLLLRFYDVSEGAVRVDDHDVRGVTLASLRSTIGYVSQEPLLSTEPSGRASSTGSRSRTTRSARPPSAPTLTSSSPTSRTATRRRSARRETGCRAASAGGSRSRVSSMRDPEIIILDEATSHVDNKTEVVIQRSLEELIADRTVPVSPTSPQRCATLTASSCLRTARSSNAGPTTSSPPTACMRTSGGSRSARLTPSRNCFSLRYGVGPDLAH